MIELIRFYKRTTVHKIDVAVPMIRFASKMLWRAVIHDLSKYRWSEAKHFAETNAEMRKVKGGSEEYDKLCQRIKTGIELHYTRNSHHPEHYLLGIPEMSALDEIEMVFDWFAASKRMTEGDVYEWIKSSSKRFKHGPERKAFYAKLAMFAEGIDPSVVRELFRLSDEIERLDGKEGQCQRQKMT